MSTTTARTLMPSVWLGLAGLCLAACGSNHLQGSSGGVANVDTSDTDASLNDTPNSERLIQSLQNNALCLGAPSGAKAGSALLLVRCDAVDAPHALTLDNNGLLHLTGSLCASAAASDPSALTLATCSKSDNKQLFAVQGGVLVSSVSALVLAPTTAAAGENATTVMVAYAPNDAQQQWSIGNGVIGLSATEASQNANVPAPSAAVVQASADRPEHRAAALTQVESAPVASFADKVPSRLKAQLDNIAVAAARYNLQPQLLIAIAMQESTGGADPEAYRNQGGMFQFTDTNTWLTFGTKNLNDRQDDGLSVTAAANYMGYLLGQHQGHLAGALREYNGAVSQGGKPSYVTDVYALMRGKL